jgi:HAD superfamily hydrolase (TIGR01490 family)
MPSVPTQDSPTAVTALSIFDLDSTLTRHGTYSPFLIFAARRLAPWRLVLIPVVLLAMLGYGLKLISRQRLKSTMHRILLGRRVSKVRVDAIAAAFADHTLHRNFHRDALTLVRAERAAGRTVIVATAAFKYYASAIAEALGDVGLIATESVWDGGDLTPAIDGQNCYGAAKLDMIKAHLEQQGIARHKVHIRFYSDHVSDAPSLEWADEPIATNPSRKLVSLAKSKGWQLLIFG